MIKTRVKKLESKHKKGTEVCIVMPGESKKRAMVRSHINISKGKDIFFIKIEGV